MQFSPCYFYYSTYYSIAIQLDRLVFPWKHNQHNYPSVPWKHQLVHYKRQQVFHFSFQVGSSLINVDAPWEQLPSWRLWCGSCPSHLLHGRWQKPMFLCYGRRRHMGVVFLPNGIDQGLLMVVELLVVSSRHEMPCRWCGLASIVSMTTGLSRPAFQ